VASLISRLRKLEEERAAEAMVLEERNLSSPERHTRRAWAKASLAERDALARYSVEGNESTYLKLWEVVLHRQAATLAADVRVHRDLLHRELEALEKQWEAEGRRHSSSQSDPQFWNLANARVNRMHALQLNKAEVIEDEKEIAQILEKVIDPQTDTQTIFRIVGRI